MEETQTIDTVFNTIINFKIRDISSETRFWMIRTKKGYFYNEFISKKFVALAWNTISSGTDFSSSYAETLNDSILLNYPEIKRPTLVANKCRSFIHDIKVNDILVIPSNSSRYITFAYAGEYYEESAKTLELERNITYRIEHGEVMVDEVTCPYLKRRHIIPIRTVKSDEINYHLYKAISSYHGISNFDEYGAIILDHLYNCYSFQDNTRLVFHVSKTDPITSKELSGFLYSVNSILSSTGIDENAISTQASVHSVGDIVFTIKNLYTWAADNYLFFIALAVILGGGKVLTIELPGVPQIIKNILSIKTTHAKEKEALTERKLQNIEKMVELQEKLTEKNIDINSLISSLEILANCSSSMQIQPLEAISEPSIEDASIVSPSDNEEETM